jgi:DNA-binding NarL/FixJ family response regulator
VGRVSLLLACCALAGLSLEAQPGKKVFISVDMEGISGISGADQLSASGAEYNRSRKLMADDTNAAIRGARAGGATDIVVNDSHGSMRNLRLEDLESGARLISHSFKRSGMMEGGSRRDVSLPTKSKCSFARRSSRRLQRAFRGCSAQRPTRLPSPPRACRAHTPSSDCCTGTSTRTDRALVRMSHAGLSGYTPMADLHR